jgi:hypothetical protein
MTELGRGFEDSLRAAVLDDAEGMLYGERGNIAYEFTQRVHDRLRSYGAELNYRVEPIIDAFEVADTERTPRRVSVTLRWNHEAAVYMEFGTSQHTIQGNPILSFVWEERHDPPDWVRREYEPEGDGYRVFLPEVEVAGVTKIRQVREALRWFRGAMR